MDKYSSVPYFLAWRQTLFFMNLPKHWWTIQIYNIRQNYNRRHTLFSYTIKIFKLYQNCLEKKENCPKISLLIVTFTFLVILSENNIWALALINCFMFKQYRDMKKFLWQIVFSLYKIEKFQIQILESLWTTRLSYP